MMYKTGNLIYTLLIHGKIEAKLLFFLSLYTFKRLRYHLEFGVFPPTEFPPTEIVRSVSGCLLEAAMESVLTPLINELAAAQIFLSDFISDSNYRQLIDPVHIQNFYGKYSEFQKEFRKIPTLTLVKPTRYAKCFFLSFFLPKLN